MVRALQTFKEENKIYVIIYNADHSVTVKVYDISSDGIHSYERTIEIPP